MKKPLAKYKIVVTRDPEQAGTFVEALKEAGTEPLFFPTIRIEPVQNYSSFKQTLSELRPGDWLVFSSVNAVRYSIPHLPADLVAQLKIAAVGPATARVLADKGITTHLMADPHTARGLLEGFKEHEMTNITVLLPCSNIARDELFEGLIHLGANVLREVVYKTVPNSDLNKDELSRLINDGRIDCITFFSPSAFTAFIKILNAPELRALKTTNIALASIGPTTSKAIRDMGFNVAIEARKSNSHGLLRAITDYLTEPHQEHTTC